MDSRISNVSSRTEDIESNIRNLLDTTNKEVVTVSHLLESFDDKGYQLMEVRNALFDMFVHDDINLNRKGAKIRVENNIE